MVKNINNKLKAIFIIFIILVLGIGIKSLAVDYTCTLTIKPEKTDIKAGESVTLSINVSDINAGEGIAIFNTILDYNAEEFDFKVQSDSEGAWTSTAIENSLTFTKANYEATSENQEIGKIILTAKEDITLGEKTITLKNNEFSNQSTFSIEDVSTTIKIVDGGDEGGDEGNTNTPGGNTNTPSDNTNIPSGNTNTPNSNTNKPSISGNINTSNSGTSNKVLPKTGVIQDCLIGAIIISVVIALGFYIKYKRAY